MRAAILGWACAWAVPLHAAQFAFGVGTSLTYESNIQRVQVNPQADLVQAVYGGFYYTENTDVIKARCLGQLERRHFYRNSFSDDTATYLDMAAGWTMIPRRLNWILEDTFREVLVDITAPDVPSNRTESNSLNTGPDFTFQLSTANSVVFGARYGRFDIRDSLNDNERYMGLARFIHNLSPQSSLSLNYEVFRVLFNPLAQPYPKILLENWFVRFQSLSAGSGAIVDLGESKVTRYTAEPLDGHIIRASLFRQLSRQSQLRVGYADQVSDAYSDQIRGITSSTAPTDSGVSAVQGVTFGAGDIYHLKRGDLAFQSRAGPIDYTLQGTARSVDFLTLDSDYNEAGGRFVANWFTGSARMNAFAEYGKRHFVSFVRDDSVRNYGAGVDYRVNRYLTLSAFASFAEQISTVPLNSYIDKRIMLALSYSTGLQYLVQSRR